MKIVDGNSIADQQAIALTQVDELMSAKRKAVITQAPGQGTVYAAKLAEAADFLKLYTTAITASIADASAWPMLAAHASAYGCSLFDAAKAIIAAAQRCQTQLGQIEQARLTAKMEVRKATTGSALDAILARLT